MNTKHLNTDLDIESSQDLTPIIEHFGEDVIVLYHGEAKEMIRASFELSGIIDGPDEIISHFCMLAESLTGQARKLWDNAFRKVFDIGYRAGDFPSSFNSEIRSETIERIAAIGASIAVTIYPNDGEE